jgi:hypothetical protein
MASENDDEVRLCIEHRIQGLPHVARRPTWTSEVHDLDAPARLEAAERCLDLRDKPEARRWNARYRGTAEGDDSIRPWRFRGRIERLRCNWRAHQPSEALDRNKEDDREADAQEAVL